jgi:hypothetical protein
MGASAVSLIESFIVVALQKFADLLNSEFAKQNPWVGYLILASLIAGFLFFVLRMFHSKNWKLIRRYVLAIGAIVAVWGLLMVTRA